VPVTPATPEAPPLRRTWPRVAGVVAVLVIGLVATLATARAARRDAEQREELLTQQTGNLGAAAVQQLLAAISGVAGLPDASGNVDRAPFEAFATEAVRETALDRLAFVEVVPEAERDEFEAEIGRPITEAPGGPRAGARDTHLAVRWVSPAGSPADELVGYDLAADPVRLAAAERARDEGKPVITETVPSQPSGQPAVFLVHPVFRLTIGDEATVAQRREAIVGYVTTAVVGTSLLDAVAAGVEDPLAIRLEDAPTGDGRQRPALAETDPPPGDGVTTERVVGGRAWRITVDDRRAVSLTGALWLLAGTVALALTLGLLARRAVRHQREVARHVVMVDRLAGLGRSLGAASTVDDLSRTVAAKVPAVLGAESAALREGRGERHGDGERDGGAARVVVRRRITVPDSPSAVLEVRWPSGGRLDDLTLAGLATVGEMCGQALERARLIDSTRRDAVSSRLFAGLAEAAATAGTTDQVARTLVERAADLPGAATTHLGILTDDGRALSVVHQGLDPARSGTTGGAGPPELHPVDHPWPLFEAFRRGTVVLLGDLDAVAERFPDVVDGMRAADLAAIACLPLVDDDERTFGAVGLSWSTPQRFDPALVDVLTTTADLCASSLARARETDRAQARSSAMAALAAHLSAASSFDEVGAAIVEHATPALGADFALVGMIEGDRFHLLAPSGPHLGALAPYIDVDVHGDFPALIAVRRRALVTFSTPTAIPDPTVAADLAALGLCAGACAPLMAADGEVTGVLIVLWAEPPAFDEALRARLTTVADLCAQSAERSRLFDAEHQVRRDLQRSVLAPAPVLAGLDLATRYRPAAAALGMGGDWYDTMALEGGRLCVVVGDVGGHGVGAVAEMTQVRTVVHTLVAGGMALPDVLMRTSEVIQRDRLGYATVLVAVIDPEAGSLDYVTAGHPPALVRRPGGTVDTLTGGRHSVLGIELVPRPPGFVPFPAGSTLVAYTDGLVEQRDSDIDTSIGGLADRVRAAGAVDAATLADRLLAERPVTSGPLDDVAVVVVRRMG
jgi:GAF domain-containing protein/CHASE1-domain containing sensor protein